MLVSFWVCVGCWQLGKVLMFKGKHQRLIHIVPWIGYSGLLHCRLVSNPPWIDVCQFHESRADLGYLWPDILRGREAMNLSSLLHMMVCVLEVNVKMLFVASVWFCIAFVVQEFLFPHLSLSLVCSNFNDPIIFLHACKLSNSSSFTHSWNSKSSLWSVSPFFL